MPGLGRYAGYTQGTSEYSVKSLTEREAAKMLPARSPLYSAPAPAANPYQTLPYASYRRPPGPTGPAGQFRTFGREQPDLLGDSR